MPTNSRIWSEKVGVVLQCGVVMVINFSLKRYSVKSRIQKQKPVSCKYKKIQEVKLVSFSGGTEECTGSSDVPHRKFGSSSLEIREPIHRRYGMFHRRYGTAALKVRERAPQVRNLTASVIEVHGGTTVSGCRVSRLQHLRQLGIAATVLRELLRRGS